VQFVEALLVEELDDALLFFHHILRLLSDQRLDGNVDNFALRLLLQPEIGILLFSLDGAIDFVEIIKAAHRGVPLFSEIVECCRAQVKERSLELGNVIV